MGIKLMPSIGVTIKTKRRKGPDGDFNDIAARLVSKAPIIAFKTSQALITMAKATAPQPPRSAWWGSDYVRTGHLRDSISPRPIKVGNGQYNVEVGADYGKFVEHGTRHMPAQPFFRESVRYVRHFVMPGLVRDWIHR